MVSHLRPALLVVIALILVDIVKKTRKRDEGPAARMGLRLAMTVLLVAAGVISAILYVLNV